MNKRVPSFWWDYETPGGHDGKIVVESDDPKVPIVARPATVKEAQTLIDDLNAGRRDYRRIDHV